MWKGIKKNVVELNQKNVSITIGNQTKIDLVSLACGESSPGWKKKTNHCNNAKITAGINTQKCVATIWIMKWDRETWKYA